MDIQVPKDKGTAFQVWCADLLKRGYRSIDTDIDDAVLTTRDLQIDVFLEDSVSEQMILAQCKSGTIGKPAKSIPDTDIGAFITRHEHLTNPAWVKEHGSQRAFDLLSDYGRHMANGWSAIYYYMTMNEEADSRLTDMIAHQNDKYKDDGVSVRCELLDRSRLREFWIRAASVEGEVGVPINSLPLPVGRYLVMDDPYPTVVAVVKANWLRDIYKRTGVRERLFALNIRDWLGKRNQINKQIGKTANEEPEHFFYYNNGVSAVCTKLKVDKEKNLLSVENFQIINGAQTVGAIVDALPHEDTLVLLRITESSSSKSQKKTINDNIIKYNNTQNVVKVSDFCANDPIQKWLESEFAKQKTRPHIPMITYQRRRGGIVKSKGRQTLRLEDLGKIRYAFEIEPTLVINSPKDLFTSKSSHSEGAYEKGFGVVNTLEPQWPEVVFHRSLLAIAFYLAIDARIKVIKKEDDSLAFLNQLKFHFLALAGAVCREYDDKHIHTLVNQEKAFAAEFDRFWRAALYLVKKEWRRNNNKENDPMTLRTFARNRKVWDQMKEDYIEYLFTQVP